MILAEMEGEKDEGEHITQSCTEERKIQVLSNLVNSYSGLSSQDELTNLATSGPTLPLCPSLIYLCVVMVDVAQVMREIASSVGDDGGTGDESIILRELNENSPSFLFLLETITVAKSIVTKRSEALKRQKRHRDATEEEAEIDQTVLDAELKAFQSSVTRVINLMVGAKAQNTIASLMLAT